MKKKFNPDTFLLLVLVGLVSLFLFRAFNGAGIS